MIETIAVLAPALVAAAVVFYGLPYAFRYHAETRLARRCQSERALVLSFDDGPGAQLTPRILALLDTHHAEATFFPLGQRARAHPELLGEIARRGHEIGCHSERHAHAFRVGPVRAVRDALGGLETLSPWLGEAPLFRPPFGRVDLATWAFLRLRGVRFGWWTLDSGDTAGADAPEAVERAVIQAGGGVVLLHDFDGQAGRSEYVLAVTERLLVAARENGLRVIALGALV